MEQPCYDLPLPPGEHERVSSSVHSCRERVWICGGRNHPLIALFHGRYSCSKSFGCKAGDLRWKERGQCSLGQHPGGGVQDCRTAVDWRELCRSDLCKHEDKLSAVSSSAAISVMDMMKVCCLHKFPKQHQKLESMNEGFHHNLMLKYLQLMKTERWSELSPIQTKASWTRWRRGWSSHPGRLDPVCSPNICSPASSKQCHLLRPRHHPNSILSRNEIRMQIRGAKSRTEYISMNKNVVKIK